MTVDYITPPQPLQPCCVTAEID